MDRVLAVTAGTCNYQDGSFHFCHMGLAPCHVMDHGTVPVFCTYTHIYIYIYIIYTGIIIIYIYTYIYIHIYIIKYNINNNIYIYIYIDR